MHLYQPIICSVSLKEFLLIMYLILQWDFFMLCILESDQDDHLVTLIRYKILYASTFCLTLLLYYVMYIVVQVRREGSQLRQLSSLATRPYRASPYARSGGMHLFFVR